MNNLAGTIAFIVATNWTTVSVENPNCHAKGCREEHYQLIYQMGIVTTNTVLNMDWRGVRKEIVLETTETHITRIGKVAIVNTNTVPLLVSKSTNQPSKPKK